jgi:phosphatidate phosphatase APP1
MAWDVIADIDDTLFETSTGRLPSFSAFINTFFKYPKLVHGMPDIFPYYRSYLNLSQYPKGRMILPDKTEIVSIYLTRTLLTYKIKRIENILGQGPGKVFLLGDTVMKDPEVYGEIYRKWPDWIIIILIRTVGSQKLFRNSPARFQRAFAEIPARSYYIFQEPSDLIPFLNLFDL